MAVIKIEKGLDLPINGTPKQTIDESKKVTKVAVLGNDYIGLKPTLSVAIGDRVKLGQLLFTDKKMPGVKFTSPGAGIVTEINRGEKRHFLSLVIELDGDEEISFKSYSESEIASLKAEEIKEQLIESGLWTSLRERPMSKVANPVTSPKAIFITAMDSNPLAPSVETILQANEKFFKDGLRLLSQLIEGNVYLCKEEGSNIPEATIHNLKVQEFSGKHPKGLVGTHIHFLQPVDRNNPVWYINAQDVVAVGKLFTTGKIDVEKIISLAGPSVKDPRYIKTRVGAFLSEIVNGELSGEENRVISGSVLSGRTMTKEEGYLGRYHQQISVVPDSSEREFFGWAKPTSKLFSVKNVLLSSFMPKKKFNFNTSMNGGERAIVPVGSYEQVMPLNILPTFLLRSLAVNDVEEAEKLGCLELDEEDLALCSYVCPSKIDHGKKLRENLTLIDKEG